MFVLISRHKLQNGSNLPKLAPTQSLPPFIPGNAVDNKSAQTAVQISAILIAAQHHDLIKITSMN